MGCSSSLQKQLTNQTTNSQSAIEQFKIGYRQFIRNDIGQVFDFYHFSKIISRNSTSLIRKVIHRVSKVERVCKIIPIQRKQNIHIIKQVQFLKNLDHPNIVQIQQYFFDKIYLYIIMQYIQGMKLSQFLSLNPQLSLDILVLIFEQLISAINFCHQKGIVHNCLHPQNILILTKNKQYILKLIDFSQASTIKSPKIQKTCFLKEYQVFKDPLLDYYTNDKNDIWSAAMIFIYMLSGQKNNTNFIKNKKQTIKTYVNAYELEQTTMNRLMTLLLKMFKQNLNQRISANQVLKDQFFTQFRIFKQKKNCRKKQDKQFLQRLMHFHVQNQLQSIFWMYVSLNVLNQNQKCQYVIQFQNLDKNKDGKLDKQQIKQSLINTFNLTSQNANTYVTKIFQSIDKNQSSSLQFSQFVMATSLISKHLSEEKLQRIFKQIDTNHDNMISLEELACIFGGFDMASTVMKQKKCISQKQFKNIMFQLFQRSKSGE